MHPALRPLRAGLALGLLAVLAAGCNLFKPASPEVGGTVSTLLPNYAAPESCLKYMRLGIERKDNVGQAAYLGALADSTTDGVPFHALFDAAVLADYIATGGTAPAGWDLPRETQFYSVLIRTFNDAYDMEWLEDTANPITNDTNDGKTAVLHRRYLLYNTPVSTGVSVLIGVGYVKMTFVHVSASRWALTIWEDHVDPDKGVHPDDAEQRTFGYRRLNAVGG